MSTITEEATPTFLQSRRPASLINHESAGSSEHNNPTTKGSDYEKKDIEASCLDVGNEKKVTMAEELELLEAYQQSLAFASSSSEKQQRMVVLQGKPGVGKTTLAHTLETHVTADGGYFAKGVFDTTREHDAAAVFVDAITNLIEAIVRRGERSVASVRKVIHQSIMNHQDSDANRSPQVELMLDSIPALTKILGVKKTTKSKKIQLHKQSSHVSLHGTALWDIPTSLSGALCSLLQAIASPERPLVLFLDDFHHATAPSLSILKDLLSSEEEENEGLFVVLATDIHAVVAGEEDEKKQEDSLPWMGALQQMKAVGVPFHNICLGDISKESMGSWLSNKYPTSRGQWLCLTDAVHSHTHGNMLLTNLYLQILREEGLLFQDKGNPENGLRWGISSSKLHTMDLRFGCFNSRVSRLVEHLLQFCSPEAIRVVKVAACMGTEFHLDILRRVVGETAVHPTILQEVVAKGILVTPGEYEYHFSHASIKECVYKLIPEDERIKLHLAIGRKILSQSQQENIEEDTTDQQQQLRDDQVFRVVHHFCLGSANLKKQSDKDQVAWLCFCAGQSCASKLSNFPVAEKYLCQGIALLDRRCSWRDQYDMSLALHNLGAEVCYSNGNVELTDQFVASILKNARSDRDRLQARTTLVYSLGARNKVLEAVKVGLEVLDSLGEGLPTRSSRFITNREYFLMKRALHGKSNADILDLPLMQNQDKLSALRVLNIVFPYLLIEQGDRSLIVACRSIRLTLTYGLSVMSAIGFCVHGILECSRGNAQYGMRFGELALAIMDKFPGTKVWKGRIMCMYWGLFSRFKMPSHHCFESLQQASRQCMETGDMEFASMSTTISIMAMLDSGIPLDKVEPAMRDALELFQTHKQERVIGKLRPLLQEVLILRGEDVEDPLTLNGSVMSHQYILERYGKDKVAYILHSCTCDLCYHLHDYEKAKTSAGICRAYARKEPFLSILDIHSVYLYGVIVLALAWKKRHDRRLKQKLCSEARQQLRRLQWLAEYVPESYLAKVYLLEAELAGLGGKIDVALRKFKDASEHAKSEGFLHEEALANERAGLALMENGRHGEARKYLEAACALYEQWGARRVAEHLRTNVIPALDC